MTGAKLKVEGPSIVIRAFGWAFICAFGEEIETEAETKSDDKLLEATESR